MAAAAIGTCWASGSWSDTAWEANTWAGATTTTTVLPGGGSVGSRGWSARGKTKYRDGKPVNEVKTVPVPQAKPASKRTPVLQPEPEITAPTPRGFRIESPEPPKAAPAVPVDHVQQLKLQAAVRVERERQRREADDNAAIEALLKLL